LPPGERKPALPGADSPASYRRGALLLESQAPWSTTPVFKSSGSV